MVLFSVALVLATLMAGTTAGLRNRKRSRRLATTDPEDLTRNLSTNKIGEWRRELVKHGCSAKWAADMALRLVAAAARGAVLEHLEPVSGDIRALVDAQVGRIG